MIPRDLDRLARARRDELVRARAAARSPARLRPGPPGSASAPAGSGRRRPIRHRTGWALVAIGLRIAASAGR